MKRIDTNPHILHFVLKRKGNFPNSKLPVLIYKKALELPLLKNKSAAIVQKLFLRNRWSNSWKNGIYDFHHYHSTTHECLGISFGSAKVILGGPGGRRIEISQGDVIILPAGVAHKCLSCSKDFNCIGAYPQGKNYDINIGRSKEQERALINIKKLALPLRDPVYGKEGFLKTFWK